MIGIWANADLTNDYISIRTHSKVEYALKSDEDFIKNLPEEEKIFHMPLFPEQVPKCSVSIELYPEYNHKLTLKGFLSYITEKAKSSNFQDTPLLAPPQMVEPNLPNNHSRFVEYYSNMENFKSDNKDTLMQNTNIAHQKERKGGR